MLKQRIITAVILAILALSAVLFLDNQSFSLLIGLVSLLAAWEWSRLCGFEARWQQALYLFLIALDIFSAYWFRSSLTSQWSLYIGVGWWLLAVIILFRVKNIENSRQGVSLLQALAGFFVIVPCWLALVTLHAIPEKGPLLVLFLMMIIWVSDTGAYFSGRAFGKHKLAPVISPGKTLEGVVGALLGALICALLLYYSDLLRTVELWQLVLLVLVCSLFSVVGDLFESLMKRSRGIKDSSDLLPGHGGVLDRLDSLFAAAPVFVVGLGLMQQW